MRRRSKLTLAVAALGVLLLAALVLAPRLWSPHGLRERVVAQIGERLGGEARIAELRLSLLPLPHVVLEGVSLSVPGAIDLESRSASVYPRILPLLGGQVSLSRIRVSGLDVSLHSTGEREEGTSRPPTPRPSPLAALRAFVASQAPGITLVADEAHLSMAPAPPDALWVERADDVQLRLVAEDDGEKLRVQIDADVPSLALRRAGERLVLTGGRVSGALQEHDEGLAVELSEIHLDEPAVAISGRFTFDPTAGRTSMEVEGKDLRVPPVLAAAQFLAPGTEAVRNVTKVLRGGVVPELSVSAKGESLSDLARLEAFRIAGRLEDGLVRPLTAGIELEEASGDVAIEGGTLSASNVAARVGRSWLRDGTVRVVLTGAEKKLHIESGDTRLVLDEIYARAEAEGWVHELLRGQSGLAGTAHLSRLSISGPLGDPRALRVRLGGSVRELKIDLTRWLGDTEFRTPVSFPELRLSREEGRTSVSGAVEAGGVAGEFEAASTPDRFELSRLRLRDAHSDVTLRLIVAATDLELGFSGQLVKPTLDALLVANPLLAGSVRGDFEARLSPAAPLRSMAKGSLEATDLTIPGDRHVKVEKLSVQAEARRFAFDADTEAPATGKAKLAGTIEATDAGLVADATLRGGDVDLGALLADADSSEGEASEQEPEASSPWRSFLQGKVDIQLDSLRYRHLRWTPFHTEVSLRPGDPLLTVREARTCGIAATGTAAFGPSGVETDAALAAKNEPIEQSISCLMGREHAVTGVYDLEARLRGKGQPSEIARWLAGSVQFDARQGRVYDIPLIARTLTTINVATGGFGSAADLRREGLPYDRLSLRGEARDGKLDLREIALEGPSVKMSGQGSVDLGDGMLDLTLLVAPLRTVDSVVGRVPLVGDALGGSLVWIPVRVKGGIGDPTVIPLDPSAVGGELKGLMERTLGIPGRALRPLLPRKRPK